MAVAIPDDNHTYLQHITAPHNYQHEQGNLARQPGVHGLGWASNHIYAVNGHVLADKMCLVTVWNDIFPQCAIGGGGSTRHWHTAWSLSQSTKIGLNGSKSALAAVQ